MISNNCNNFSVEGGIPSNFLYVYLHPPKNYYNYSLRQRIYHEFRQICPILLHYVLVY